MSEPAHFGLNPPPPPWKKTQCGICVQKCACKCIIKWAPLQCGGRSLSSVYRPLSTVYPPPHTLTATIQSTPRNNSNHEEILREEQHPCRDHQDLAVPMLRPFWNVPENRNFYRNLLQFCHHLSQFTAIFCGCRGCCSCCGCCGCCDAVIVVVVVAIVVFVVAVVAVAVVVVVVVVAMRFLWLL